MRQTGERGGAAASPDFSPKAWSPRNRARPPFKRPPQRRHLCNRHDPAQTLLVGSAPAVADPSPEQEQLPQLLRGFLAVVEQDIGELKTSIEQLKTSQEQMGTARRQLKQPEQMVRDNAAFAEQLKAAQEQMARDNAAVAEQLKATQEQMARLIAKASEQQLGPKTSAPPPQSIATPTGRPVPKLSSPQARAQPQGRPVQRSLLERPFDLSAIGLDNHLGASSPSCISSESQVKNPAKQIVIVFVLFVGCLVSIGAP